MNPLPTEDFDQFDPKNLAFPVDRLGGNGQSPVPRTRAKSRKLFVQIPFEHVPLLASLKSAAAFSVYCVLFQAWFANSNRWNPVRLNREELKRLGFCGEAVRRALQGLKTVGLIYVDQFPGQSPIVTLRWQELNKRPM